MQKTGYQSNRIQKNDTRTIDNVTSFTVTNDGDTDLTLTIAGVSRIVPAKKNETHSYFDMPFDGTYSDYEIEFSFVGGRGSAILDFKQLKTC